MIEADAETVAERLRIDFPKLEPLRDPIWRESPPAKVVDCVLSLRKKYDTVVVPRVKKFVTTHPDVVTCQQLRALIDGYPRLIAFFQRELSMNSPGKAHMLSGVVDYVLDVQRRFEGETENDRLSAWARWARPGDYITVEVHGFKLAGFQYLRMLFGADTVKPDVHIIRYVERILERTVSEARVVYTLERAAELVGRPARSIDVAIWEQSARQTSTS